MINTKILNIKSSTYDNTDNDTYVIIKNIYCIKEWHQNKAYTAIYLNKTDYIVTYESVEKVLNKINNIKEED